METSTRYLTVLGVSVILLFGNTPCDTLPTIHCGEVYQKVNSTFECQCLPDPANPGTTVSWRNHSQNGTLKIFNVQKDDDGRVFTCDMMSGSSISNARCSLNVTYGPSEVVINGPSPFPTDGNKELKLQCLATGTNPQPHLTWSSICDNGQTSSVCIFTPKLQDNGTMVNCTAVNPPAQQTRTAMFEVVLTTLSGVTTQYTSTEETGTNHPTALTPKTTGFSTFGPAAPDGSAALHRADNSVIMAQLLVMMALLLFHIVSSAWI